MKHLAQDKPVEETIRDAVNQAVALLVRSERGRDVAGDLERFLQGRVSGLDQQGWEAIDLIIDAYRAGYAGTALESLHPWRILSYPVK